MLAGAGIGYAMRKRTAEMQIGSAETEAKRIIEDAEAKGESKKKEALLEAKEDVHRLRQELDRDTRERRSELQRQERRIVQKEENLDRKMDSLEKKEEALEKKESKLDKSQAAIDELHAEEVRQAIEEVSPHRILILGTSENMVHKIAKILELPSISKIVHIEDIATKSEMEKARVCRVKEGKHIIPVPTIELKPHFSGYLIDPIQSFFKKSRTKRRRLGEKSIVRPVFSYYGKLVIDDSAIKSIVYKLVGEKEYVTKVGSIRVRHAEDEYQTTLKDSRMGADLTTSEAKWIGSIIAPLLKNGLSPYQIIQTHPELHISVRTLYNYIEDDTLHGVRDKYEAFHRAQIKDEAIEAAVRLSHRYITDRFLPDKAIDLMRMCRSRRNSVMSSSTPSRAKRLAGWASSSLVFCKKISIEKDTPLFVYQQIFNIR